MRTFEASTSLDTARDYVNSELVGATNAWPKLFAWAESNSERLQAIVERNPPVKTLAEYLKLKSSSFTTLKPTIVVKMIEYGKSALLDEFLKLIKNDNHDNHYNPNWLFARFPCSYTPTVRRCLVKYTSEAVASVNGKLLMLPSLNSYTVDWISEIALKTPRTFEQTKDIIIAIAKVSRNGLQPAALKNINAMLQGVTEKQRQDILQHANNLGLDLTSVKQKETSASVAQPLAAQPVQPVQPKSIPALDPWNVRQLLNKPRLNDDMVDSIVHNSTPQLVDKQYRTLLERVVLQGLTTSFEKVVKAGGNLQKVDMRGENLAHKAGRSKRKKMLEMVIDAGVDPWSKDQRGETVLHQIVLSCPNMIDVLMKHPNANPNAVDNYGNTALFCLFPPFSSWDKKMTALKSANILLQAGVDANIRNKMGATFLDVARSRAKSSEGQALISALEETVTRFQNYKLAVALDEVVSEPAMQKQNKKKM